MAEKAVAEASVPKKARRDPSFILDEAKSEVENDISLCWISCLTLGENDVIETMHSDRSIVRIAHIVVQGDGAASFAILMVKICCELWRQSTYSIQKLLERGHSSWKLQRQRTDSTVVDWVEFQIVGLSNVWQHIYCFL